MLSDEVIDKVVERLVTRIEDGNLFVLKKIAEGINKIGTLSPSNVNKIDAIMFAGGDFDKIVKELARITKLNEKEIYEIFAEVAKSDYEFAKKFYDYRKIKYIPFDENELLKQQVEAIARITADAYKNISKTTSLGFAVPDENGKMVFRGLKEQYQKILDEAIINVSQGKETFAEAMYHRMNEISESGIKVLYDNEGKQPYARRLDTSVRMNLKEGLTNLHNEMQEEFGKQFDSDGIEVSVHSAPAPDHEEVQGRQFSKKEFKKLQEEGIAKDVKGRVHNLHLKRKDGSEVGTFRPVGKMNCYHYNFAIVLGVSESEYTDEQLQEIIDDNDKGFEFEGKHYSLYEGTQLQRRIETEIRKQKDAQIAARAMGDAGNLGVSVAQSKIEKLTNKYKELSDVSGLPTRVERMRVKGYRKVKVEAKKSYKEFYKLIEED